MRDVHDLVDAVRDEYDPDVRGRETANDPEQVPALVAGERRRGLVEDEDARVSGERFRGSPQAVGFREPHLGDRPPDIQADPEPGGEPLGLRTRQLPVE